MHLSVDYLSAHKTKLQIGYVSLAVLAFILATTRLALASTTVSRGSTFPIVVSLKSMVIMSYELLTEQSLRFQRWRSLKAIAILNVSEPVFWATACILAILSTSGAHGAAAAISVILLLVSLVIVFSGVCLAMISVREYRAFKANRAIHGSSTLVTEAKSTEV